MRRLNSAGHPFSSTISVTNDDASGARDITVDLARALQVAPQQAFAARDALVKIMYDRLFTYLVKRINSTVDDWQQRRRTHVIDHQCSWRSAMLLSLAPRCQCACVILP